MGDFPIALAVNPSTDRVYVANRAADSVSVIDGASNAVVATVPVGDEPHGVAVNPSNDRVYVANVDDTVSVIADPPTITLEPPHATNPIGTDHKVTATIEDASGPIAGLEVTFDVISGPNSGATGTCNPNADCTTNTSGQVSFTYTDTAGLTNDADDIQACFVDNQEVQHCAEVDKTWEEPTPTPTPTPTSTATPAPTTTATPAPTAVAGAAQLPDTGGTPSDGGSSALPWLAAIAGAIATAGSLVLAYQRSRIRPPRPATAPRSGLLSR